MARKRFYSKLPNKFNDQTGYILLVTPIVIIGLILISYQMINRAKTSMKVAGANLDHLQTEFCNKQCGSVSINRAVFQLNSGMKLVPENLNCPCQTTPPQAPVTCNTSMVPANPSIREGCYGRKFYYQNISLSVNCENDKGRTSLLKEDVELGQTPIFQYAVFYDGPLEFQPGSTLNVHGLVHSNDTIIFANANDLTFDDWVTSADTLYFSIHRSGVGKTFFPMMDGSGSDKSGYNNKVKSLTSILTRIPNYTNWKLDHRVAFNGQENQCDPVTRMTLPFKNLENNHTLIEWRDLAKDDASMIRLKYAYKANLIYDGGWKNRQLSPVAFVTDPIKKPVRAGDPVFEYMATTLPRITFWEPREGIMLGLIPIDVLALQQRDATDSIIYLRDNLAAIGGKSNDAGGFLLYNGEKLLRPLTIATNSRIVLLGNFNTDSSYKYSGVSKSPFPAALVSDAMLQMTPWFLPSEHTLTNHSVGPSNMGSSVSFRAPKNAKVIINTCILTGMPTLNGSVLTPYAGQTAGGGYNNLVRTLEDWSSNVTFQKSGSMVCIWYSTIGTGQHLGYDPPRREFWFDDMYNSMENMPPETPRLVTPLLINTEIARH